MLIVLGKLSPKKICFYLDIIKIARTPHPWVFGHLQGTLTKKSPFKKKDLKQFGFRLDPTPLLIMAKSKQIFVAG